MGFLILVVVLAVVAGVVGAVVLAVNAKRKYASSNEVVPGRTSAAPANWAGAHTPEAKLHRRLVAAAASLRAHPLLEEGTGMLESRVTLEEQMLDLDERLVAVAALPEPVRAQPLAQIGAEVDAVEQAVAAVAVSGAPASSAGPAAIERQAGDLASQLDERAAVGMDLDSTAAVAAADAPEPAAEPEVGTAEA